MSNMLLLLFSTKPKTMAAMSMSIRSKLRPAMTISEPKMVAYGIRLCQIEMTKFTKRHRNYIAVEQGKPTFLPKQSSLNGLYRNASAMIRILSRIPPQPAAIINPRLP